MDELMDGWKDELMDALVDELMGRCVDGHGLIDECMDEWLGTHTDK
jgi:hypothetical protein